MVKALGALLVVSCCTLLGLVTVGRSQQRLRSLGSLLAALDQMKAELEDLLPPLPDLLGSLRLRAEQPAAEFFSQVIWLTEKKRLSFQEAWERAAEETEALCLRPEEAKALSALGAVLGRYETDAQCAAVERVRQRLALFRELEEKDRARKNRLSAALGAGAGITLAILLL
jgi:stage III sporulation protein AB